MSTNIINLDETAKNSNSSSVEIFKSEEFGEIRVVFNENNEPVFCLSDLCRVLELTPKGVNQRLNKEVISNYPLKTNGGIQRMLFVNEDGLYDVILESRKPEAKKFRKWITSEVLPSIRKTGSYSITQEVPKPVISPEELELKKLEAEARLIEAKNRTAEMFLSIGDRTSIPEYKQILDSYAANTLAGKEILALPEACEKTYSATEIGKILGVSANKIGKLANQYNLKIPEFGKLFYDKSRYSNKEVETFRYYDKAINKFRELLK